MQTYLIHTGLRIPVLKFRRLPVFLWVGLLSGLSCFGQDSLRFKKNLEALSSRKMMGRGYLFNGHLKAADFVRDNFRKAGLKPVGSSYFQDFTLSQNVFPTEPRLWLNGRPLKAGTDFLPGAGSVSINQTLPLRRWEDRAKFGKGRAGAGYSPSAFLLPEKQKPILSDSFPGAVFLRPMAKLTHTLDENQSLPLVIDLKKSALRPDDSLIKLKIDSKVLPGIRTRNVVGLVEGTSVKDSFLVVCAHYDHLGAMGKPVFFPGANDNASGTSLLMEMAYEISRKPLKYSVVFIAFSGEEAGLKGSFYFTEHPLVPLSSIKFVMNLDLMGFGETGATVVNATLHPELFERLKSLNASRNYLPELKARGKAANSDHFPFSERGVPAFFMYSLGGPGHYHDVSDTPETLSLAKMKGMYGLILDFLRSF